MGNLRDVDILLPGAGKFKAILIESFRKAFKSSILYRINQEDRKRPEIVEAIGGKDTLINEGYFISKKTLDKLQDAIDNPAGGVWIFLGLGRTHKRLNEIQLILTATDSPSIPKDAELGKLSFTTAQYGDPVDPPYTGVPSPSTT